MEARMGQDADSTPYFEGTRPKLDPDRIRRSLEYHASPFGSAKSHTFEVVKTTDLGNSRTVTTRPLNCDCGDAVYHNQICKHLIAALYADSDKEALEAYAEIELGAEPPRGSARGL
jgi:hypothetical protein